jgi:hypothetical protein
LDCEHLFHAIRILRGVVDLKVLAMPYGDGGVELHCVVIDLRRAVDVLDCDRSSSEGRIRIANLDIRFFHK